MTIYTIGHSTRSFDAFRALLEAHAIEQVADIRTIPASRRHPQFAGPALADALVARGIEVRHIATDTSAAPHALTEFARTDANGRVTYPGVV